MPRITHTIGGIDFGGIDSSSLRQSLGCFLANEEVDVKAFHPPGTNGNVTIWAGRYGQKIVGRQRYVGELGEVMTAYKDDREAWAQGPVEIIDSDNDTIARCRLVGMDVTKPPQPVASDGEPLCVMETQATFTRDS